MECETKYVDRVVQKYNRRHATAFVRARAEKKFLGPLGLALHSLPPADFGNCTNRLSCQEELELFRALHFMKYKLKEAIGASKRSKSRYLDIYLALRNRGISANWSLVPNCIEQHTRRFTRADLHRLMEQGNFALISSVDCFDPWRGYRFSTYACNSILTSFIRKTSSYSEKSLDDQICDQLETCVDEATELWLERLNKILNTSCLDNRERSVLAYRYKDTKLTLKEIALIWGLTKERIRQIQMEALNKLKERLKNDTVLH